MKYLLFLIFILAACEQPLGIEDNVRKTIMSGDLIPLRVNNEWIYQINEYDENLHIINGPFHQTIKISDTRHFNEETWYKFFDNTNHLEQYLRSEDDGLWMRMPDIFPGEQIRFVKLPARINESDTITNFELPRDDTKLLVQTLISTDLIVEVNGNEYQVIKIKFDHIDSDNNKYIGPYLEQFYATGLGLIKENYYSVDQNGQFFISKIREMVEATIQ